MMSTTRSGLLSFLGEPSLEFGYGQALHDPRDGLMLFGPYEALATRSVAAGVVGTAEGIALYKKWVTRISHPIFVGTPTSDSHLGRRPPFFGFEQTFGIAWDARPVAEIGIDTAELTRTLYLDDAHIRVTNVVDLFVRKIVHSVETEDAQAPQLWFIVIPDIVKKYCRPTSTVQSTLRIKAAGRMRPKDAIRSFEEPFLLDELNTNAKPYFNAPDFHNQLKAAFLKKGILTQIVLESTLNYAEFSAEPTRVQRSGQVLEAGKAWNLGSSIYYKLGGRPWKLAAAREGVCYVGLVFKRAERESNPAAACCAAQMFLNSGDGMVFKGHVGPWYTAKRGDFHLSERAACELLAEAIATYRAKHDNAAPTEVFIHGRTRLSEDELRGFQAAVPPETKVVGIQISAGDDFRFYRIRHSTPIVRGTALILDDQSGYLWTRGFVPRLQTYPGVEVPVPLRVRITSGEADLEQVMQDILALTKLNYNSCTFADGVPVTLKFADAIGEILIAGRHDGRAPLPFRHYI